MGIDSQAPAPDTIRSAEIVLPCPDLDAALTWFTERLGFRVDMIMPADAPAVAVISGHGTRLRLETSASDASPPSPVLRLNCADPDAASHALRDLRPPEGLRVVLESADTVPKLSEGSQELTFSYAGDAAAWSAGRAGMQYRDLITGRLGGRFIASHIRIPEAGKVPDYVHYHNIRFQMIYCRAGWVRVVYEDQGPAFLLQAGDCVLQPPGIRHRVLESSGGLEVIEIGCPAVHETWTDHVMMLPSGSAQPERRFEGQRFVRHVAAAATWHPWHAAGLRAGGFEARDSGISEATGGLASVRVARAAVNGPPPAAQLSHDGELLFLFVLNGALDLEPADGGDAHHMDNGDCCTLPASENFELHANESLQLLEVRVPA